MGPAHTNSIIKALKSLIAVWSMLARALGSVVAVHTAGVTHGKCIE